MNAANATAATSKKTFFIEVPLVCSEKNAARPALVHNSRRFRLVYQVDERIARNFGVLFRENRFFTKRRQLPNFRVRKLRRVFRLHVVEEFFNRVGMILQKPLDCAVGLEYSLRLSVKIVKASFGAI